MKTIFCIALAATLLVGCGGNGLKHDASGVFEAVEVVVSSEVQGPILALNVTEGDLLNASQEVGLVDTMQLYLSKLQAQRGVSATESRKSDIALQIAATRVQIENARIEKARVEKLVASGAAGVQQLDNVSTQLRVFESQLGAQLSSLGRGNESLSSEALSQIARVAQLDDQISRSIITSPISGTVLVRYAEAGEYAVPGKALFSIANIDTLELRAYVTSDQLTRLKLGQEAAVFADYGDDESREYSGRVTWISAKAEFTPKTIQTRDERANLVYAVKVAVPNDGYLKIGMYGEVNF